MRLQINCTSSRLLRKLEYKSGKYAGRAYFGTGGSATAMKAPAKLPKYSAFLNYSVGDKINCR